LKVAQQQNPYNVSGWIVVGNSYARLSMVLALGNVSGHVDESGAGLQAATSSR
jgi:hypothetical protein